MQMITIGVMTGNSLDGVDAVMTDFSDKGDIHDIAGISIPYSSELKQNMLELRQVVTDLHSDMAKASKLQLFKTTLSAYTDLVALTIEQLIEKSGVDKNKISAVGLHGQSCGEHNPPSLAQGAEPFTTQIFDAPTLAKKIGLPVIYDFRSDDIFNGGEGAPLAPMHNLHLSYALAKQGMFPICFINGGNTANIAVITSGDTLRKKVLGFDCGPFNHYVDFLARAFFDKDFDEDGKLALEGHINSMLLNDLYNEAALTADGENYLDILPPKSSGPHLYRMEERLKNYPLAEADILRTVEYFAAYTVFLSLRFIPEKYDFPRYFLMFGGGWKNPLIYRDFISLLTGRGLVLPQHAPFAEAIHHRLRGEKFYASLSDELHISGQYMEARIMADLARCFLLKKKFTASEITGCKKGAICGIICNPNENTRRKGRGFLYSRAAKGWSKLKK